MALFSNETNEKFANWLQSPQAMALTQGLLYGGQPGQTLSSGLLNASQTLPQLQRQIAEQQRLQQQMDLAERAQQLDEKKFGLQEQMQRYRIGQMGRAAAEQARQQKIAQQLYGYGMQQLSPGMFASQQEQAQEQGLVDPTKPSMPGDRAALDDVFRGTDDAVLQNPQGMQQAALQVQAGTAGPSALDEEDMQDRIQTAQRAQIYAANGDFKGAMQEQTAYMERSRARKREIAKAAAEYQAKAREESMKADVGINKSILERASKSYAPALDTHKAAQRVISLVDRLDSLGYERVPFSYARDKARFVSEAFAGNEEARIISDELASTLNTMSLGMLEALPGTGNMMVDKMIATATGKEASNKALKSIATNIANEAYKNANKFDFISDYQQKYGTTKGAEKAFNYWGEAYEMAKEMGQQDLDYSYFVSTPEQAKQTYEQVKQQYSSFQNAFVDVIRDNKVYPVKVKDLQKEIDKGARIYDPRR